MNSSQIFTTESEKLLADLEKKLNYSDNSASKTGCILWLCEKLSDLPPLLAALSDEPKALNSIPETKEIFLQYPLFLRYSESFNVDLYINDLSKFQTNGFFERLDIDSSATINDVSGGVIRISSGNESPFHLSNANETINFLIKLLADDPGNISQLLTAIHLEGPFALIKDLEITICSNYSETASNNPDIIWMALSQGNISGIYSLPFKINEISNIPAIIPIIVLDMESLSNFENEATAAGFLKTCCENFEKNTNALSNGTVFPTFLLNSTWYIDGFNKTSFEEDVFNLLWKTTGIAGFNASIKRRLGSLTDFVLQKPSSVIGLLRQKTNLEILNNLPDSSLNYPEFSEFKNLCQKGIEKYSAEVIRISEQKKSLEDTALSITASPAVIVSEIIIENTHNFLNEISQEDFCRDRHKDFEELAKLVKQEGLNWERGQFENFITDIDEKLSQIGNSLNEIDENLQSEIKNLKGLLDSLTVNTIRYTPEEIENLTFFWKGFIPLTFKKIKDIKPDDEIKKVCERTKTEFIENISLTPGYYDEFNKAIKKYWPGSAKKIIDQFEQSALIWELKINDELTGIEEFREKNFPLESKIPSSIKINISPKPILKQSLNFQIKKPGFLDIFVSQQDKEQWHSDTIHKISNYVSETVRDYLKDVAAWILTVQNGLNKQFAEIEKIGNNSLLNISEKQLRNKKTSEEAVIVKRDIDTLEKNINKLNDNIKKYKALTEKWKEIEETGKAAINNP